MPSLRSARTPQQRRRVRSQRAVSRVREDVFFRDDFACRYCGSRGRPLRIDHAQPLGRDGTDHKDNLRTACEPCDVAKGDMTEEEFLALPRTGRREFVRGESRP